MAGKGKGKQSKGGQCRAEGCDFVGAKSFNKPCAEQTGNSCPAIYYGCNKAAIGKGKAKLPVNCRPSRPEEGVRYPKADKSDVNNR